MVINPKWSKRAFLGIYQLVNNEKAVFVQGRRPRRPVLFTRLDEWSASPPTTDKRAFLGIYQLVNNEKAVFVRGRRPRRPILFTRLHEWSAGTPITDKNHRTDAEAMAQESCPLLHKRGNRSFHHLKILHRLAITIHGITLLYFLNSPSIYDVRKKSLT